VDDLAVTRFAVSSLAETVLALQFLRTGDANPVNLPWLRRARHDLSGHPLSLPLLWPLLLDGRRSRPEFLTPAPTERAPSFTKELERLLATTPGQVRASLKRVFGHPDSGSWPDSAVELAARPGQTLELIAEELTSAHVRLIAPHWDRMRAVPRCRCRLPGRHPRPQRRCGTVRRAARRRALGTREGNGHQEPARAA
jgi:hypothetical protein